MSAVLYPEYVVFPIRMHLALYLRATFWLFVQVLRAGASCRRLLSVAPGSFDLALFRIDADFSIDAIIS